MVNSHWDTHDEGALASLMVTRVRWPLRHEMHGDEKKTPQAVQSALPSVADGVVACRTTLNDFRAAGLHRMQQQLKLATALLYFPACLPLPPSPIQLPPHTPA